MSNPIVVHKSWIGAWNHYVQHYNDQEYPIQAVAEPDFSKSEPRFQDLIHAARNSELGFELAAFHQTVHAYYGKQITIYAESEDFSDWEIFV
jgi:hypothetical protein